jgi:15-cis-phytoene synthase/lycopene beta-cyclase
MVMSGCIEAIQLVYHLLTNNSYSYCRVADDLVDNAPDGESAHKAIHDLEEFLGQAFPQVSVSELVSERQLDLNDFPSTDRSALKGLPKDLLSPAPLYDLLEGFRTDLKFVTSGTNKARTIESYPIKTEEDLNTYALQVAGTVAALCIQLVFYHCLSAATITPERRTTLIRAGERMGVALQCVNIARDIFVDAAIGRVYIPTEWFSGSFSPELLRAECNSLVLQWDKRREASSTSSQKFPQLQHLTQIEGFRKRLLDKAFTMYEEVKLAMDELPEEARGPMKVAIESYMEIGRVLKEESLLDQLGKNWKGGGRATVSKSRRLRVAWKALNS